MKYRIKTWEQMLAMDGSRLNDNMAIVNKCGENSFVKGMECYSGEKVNGPCKLGPFGIAEWMLEEIKEPDVYETHKANLYAHGVKLPAMMEVQSGTVWIKSVVYFISPVGLAVCSDRGYCGYRRIRKEDIEGLKNSAYLGLK